MSNDTQTLTLSAFLLARIEDDEATDMHLPHGRDCQQFGGWPDDPASAVDCNCRVGRRVLAECEAKRAIIKAWHEADKMYGGDVGAYMDGVLRALASVYADHPDFNPDWS